MRRVGRLGCALIMAGCNISTSSSESKLGAPAASDDVPPVEPETDSTTGDGGSGSDDAAFEEELDVPGDAPDTQTPGCQKIDFLFVIDNSESMEDEQQRLIDGFPGFIEGVRETIEDFDHHVMVVTTDAEDMSFDPCENTLGAGQVRDSDGNDCGLLSDYLNGQRYVDESRGDLVETFACMADVGTDGRGDEKTVHALADAITEHNGPGACNDGFLREDAILVVTIISDEEDSPDDEPPGSDYDDNSPGDPPQWRQGLVDAKSGDDEAVIVLALVGDSDQPDALCAPYMHPGGDGAEPGIRIRELADSLPYGSWTSVCQDDYADFFNQAIDDIDHACAGFTPAG